MATASTRGRSLLLVTLKPAEPFHGVSRVARSAGLPPGMARVFAATVLAWLIIEPVGAGPHTTSGGGLLLASFDSDPGRSPALKDLLVSLTLHDSGKTTSPLPVQQGTTGVVGSVRLSFSTRDHSVVLVLATAISSSNDPGAGRPVAVLSQAEASSNPVHP
jgi:hypothetical protein